MHASTKNWQGLLRLIHKFLRRPRLYHAGPAHGRQKAPAQPRVNLAGNRGVSTVSTRSRTNGEPKAFVEGATARQRRRRYRLPSQARPISPGAPSALALTPKQGAAEDATARGLPPWAWARALWRPTRRRRGRRICCLNRCIVQVGFSHGYIEEPCTAMVMSYGQNDHCFP